MLILQTLRNLISSCQSANYFSDSLVLFVARIVLQPTNSGSRAYGRKPVAPNGALSLLINKTYKFNQIVSPLGRHVRMSIVIEVMRSVELMNSCIHSVI